MRSKYIGLIIISFITIFESCKKTVHEIPQYGMYEASFKSTNNDSFFQFPQVSFHKPNGSIIKVDGFYNGGNKYIVRAYCNEPGLWKWELHQNPNFMKNTGRFRVVNSKLKGKLKKHPDDPYQFAYDNNEWFLHIGDTGYRYLSEDEPKWKEYIDQAKKIGMTKIRTWFNSSRHGVEELFDKEHTTINLPYWQEIDKRISYAYENYPELILQLIPFGEDSKELKRYYAGDTLSYIMVRYAQARFSAYPNIFWCISNDMKIIDNKNEELTGRREILKENIEKIGRDMKHRESWGTLITNHQARREGYSFVDARWSDIITLEDIDQGDGRLILEYRAKGSDPVVLDEDRYELYIKPAYPRYYFRRLMWVSLLSGGHATYGGIHTFISFHEGSMKNIPEDEEHLYGVQGYYDVGLKGADDFLNIKKFFNESGLTLVDMKPDDKIAGNIPQQVKCIHNDSIYIIYLANPDKIGKPSTQYERYDEAIRSANEGIDTPYVSLILPHFLFAYRWYDPSKGEWSETNDINGGTSKFVAPGPGDWILLISKK